MAENLSPEERQYRRQKKEFDKQEFKEKRNIMNPKERNKHFMGVLKDAGKLTTSNRKDKADRVSEKLDRRLGREEGETLVQRRRRRAGELKENFDQKAGRRKLEE